MTPDQERLLREAETHWDATGIIADLARELRVALADAETVKTNAIAMANAVVEFFAEINMTEHAKELQARIDAALAARSGAEHE